MYWGFSPSRWAFGTSWRASVISLKNVNQIYGITDALRGGFTGSVHIGLLGLRCVCWLFLWFSIPNTLPCAPLRTELGFLLLNQFLVQDKAVVSAVCWICAFWVSSSLDGLWMLWGKIFLLLVQVVPWTFSCSRTVLLCSSKGRTWLSWHLSSIYMCKWEEKGEPVTGNKLWILDRETCVFTWIVEKIRNCPVPGELVIAGEVPVRGKAVTWRAVSSGMYCVPLSCNGDTLHTGVNATVKCKGMVKYSGCVVILYVILSWERQQYFLSPAFYFLAQWWEIYQAWISQHRVLPSMCINCLDELPWSSLCLSCLVLKLCSCARWESCALFSDDQFVSS